MDTAILHYHLQRGGVTQVILNQLRALAAAPAADQPQKVAVLYGGRDDAWPRGAAAPPLPFRVTLIPLPDLEYDDLRDSNCSPQAVADIVEAALHQHQFDRENTVLHIHNHALGKQAALPGGLSLLAQRGWPQLLQLHDFAEDFRPANYQSLLRRAGLATHDDVPRYIYPQAPQLHYAVLTHHDRLVLEEAGVPVERLHLLANPVVLPTQLPDREGARQKLRRHWPLDPDKRWLFYPVRGIRRKNVGELLLWAALCRQTGEWGVTQQPLNPQEAASYHHWKELAAELRLPCSFGVGELGGVSFGEVMAAADGLVTTSVAEGFGMVFLEAPLLGHSLIGRDLPDVTADFRQHGLTFEGLRRSLPFSLESPFRQQAQQHAEALFSDARAAYGLSRSLPATTRSEFAEIFAAPIVDFALLGREQQTTLLRELVQGRRQSSEMSAWQTSLWDRWPELDAETTANATRIEKAFGLKAAGHRLADVYRSVRESARAAHTESLTHGANILESFLKASRLRPCRLEP